MGLFSPFHSLSANFNVMPRTQYWFNILCYCFINRDYCISGKLCNVESVLYFTNTLTKAVGRTAGEACAWCGMHAHNWLPTLIVHVWASYITELVSLW